MRIIIIGAGLLGSALAFRAAQSGLAVEVLDAGRPGHGATIGSFAWLNAHDKLPRAYHEFTLRALDAHRRLRDELQEADGACAWRHEGGAIEWVAGAAAIARQQERITRLRDWGVAVEWLDAAQWQELEPDIAPEAIGDAPVAWYPNDAWIDPLPFIGVLLRRARSLGARLRQGASVVALRQQGEAVHGVTLADGTAIAADVVVNCSGAAINALTAGLCPIPLLARRGLTAMTQPVAGGVRRVVKAAQCYLRPDGAGRLMLHGKEADAALSADTPASTALPAVRDLLDRAAQVLPGCAGIAAETVRIVTRPYPADGYPVVGELPGLRGYHLAVMHSGAILAPLMAELILEDLDGGCAALEAFRPGRFAAAGVS